MPSRIEPGGQQAHALGVQPAAGGDGRARGGDEQGEGAGQRPAVDGAGEQPRHGGGAAADRQGDVGPRGPGTGQHELGVGPQRGQLVAGRRVGVQVGVGEDGGPDGDGRRPLDARVQRADRQLRRAAADVDDGDAPGVGRTAGRTGEGEARLLVAVEHLDLHARTRAHGVPERVGVGGGADGGRRDHAQPLCAQAAGDRDLDGDDLRQRRQRVLRQRPRPQQQAAQPGVGLLAGDLAQPVLPHVGDEDPGGVGADVDAGAAHTLDGGS